MSSVETAERFLRELTGRTERQQARLLAKAPWTDIQVAALQHPDPQTRRWFLSFLDHFANDSSMATFAEALRDPEEHVRTAALHGISCDACKKEEMCVADVVVSLVEVLLHDPVADLKIRSLQQLTYLASQDQSVATAIAKSASSDPDPVVRRAATAALKGHFVLPAKRYERSRLRHASTRSTR